MYEITFQGITPNKMFNRISVVGNNNADIIKFIVPVQQTSISLAGMTAYIKVQSKSGLYLNKERLESVEDAANIVSTWTLTDEYTQYKQLECQLQFQDNDSNVVWQSEIFYLTLSSTIRTDAYISNKYPTILNQLENDIVRLDEEKVDEQQVNAAIKADKDIISKIKMNYDEDSDITYVRFPPGITPLSITMNNELLFIKNDTFVNYNGDPAQNHILNEYYTDSDSQGNVYCCLTILGWVAEEVISSLTYINFDKDTELPSNTLNFFSPHWGPRLYKHTFRVGASAVYIISTAKDRITNFIRFYDAYDKKITCYWYGGPLATIAFNGPSEAPVSAVVTLYSANNDNLLEGSSTIVNAISSSFDTVTEL